MASDDRPKLPRATVRDEKLYVEGENEPYFQRSYSTRSWLRVDALTIRRGYAPDETSKAFAQSLYGIAMLEGRDRLRDRFAVIGLETDPATLIRFHLQSVPDTENHGKACCQAICHSWQGLLWRGLQTAGSVCCPIQNVSGNHRLIDLRRRSLLVRFSPLF